MEQIQSSVSIDIQSDINNVPEHIDWCYGDQKPKQTKAFMLAIWDKNEQRSLHIDIWTKEMSKDEMHHFIFQTMNTMADTYSRATGNKEMANKIQKVANELEKEVKLGL